MKKLTLILIALCSFSQARTSEVEYLVNKHCGPNGEYNLLAEVTSSAQEYGALKQMLNKVLNDSNSSKKQKEDAINLFNMLAKEIQSSLESSALACSVVIKSVTKKNIDSQAVVDIFLNLYGLAIQQP